VEGGRRGEKEEKEEKEKREEREEREETEPENIPTNIFFPGIGVSQGGMDQAPGKRGEHPRDDRQI
jgi:hypothetical protein